MKKIVNDNYEALLRLRIEYLRMGFSCSEIEDDYFYVCDLDTSE